ncbi:MAG: ABC transporter ATP-binding protein [Desulfovibrio sp.]|uniref:ABC transporter ATP-binding protein n=1 Tax=Desulfovibrio sp. TaxID=885 RepID=UPI002A35AC07|nr:ABC transporter ATP-binding protein [Desulfovibrio sp.]MDY0258969.1 ABC transporter ATP-binding protein [Desulfovibrio sp.]
MQQSADCTGFDAKIAVRDLTKTYGDLVVLDKINFSIKRGELVSIVGPTGCGKTTFLNCMSKLTETTSGNIYIDGEVANPRKHNLAFVFQEPTALPWLTVSENVGYGMRIKKMPKPEMEKRLDFILDLVGLKDTANLYPNQVSASMMQRIAVARAFAVNPDLLLMDEPYGQLDVKLRFYLEDELVKLWQTLKSTVLFVTHNIEEAVYVADRILVLSPKPTKVRAEVVVDLPRPRDFRDPKFIELRRQVTDLIRWW